MRNELESKKDYLKKLESDAKKLTKEEQVAYGVEERINRAKKELSKIEYLTSVYLEK